MPHFALDAAQANKGDALLIRWGDHSGSHLMLIDGGPGAVWDDFVLPHLQRTVGVNPVGVVNPIHLDAVVVSHVDDDHINGIIDLADQIRIANQTAGAKPVTIGDLWHNSFRDMQFLADFADEPKLQDAIKRTSADEHLLSTEPPPDDPSKGLAAGRRGVRQGRRLDQVLGTIGLDKNKAFGRGFVEAAPGFDFLGLTVTVLAPNDELLEKLKKQWKVELRKILRSESETDASGVRALAQSFDDPSVPNQSSIVLLIEFGGKTMLLTGDARGDHLLDAFEANAAVLDTPLKVDLFKLPHHGSAHSNGPELFAAIQADHYVISGNGEHGNPHPDALRALFDSTAGRPITVHLTNRPTAGAKKAEDIVKAHEAVAVLDDAEGDNNVTIVYRDENETAVSVDLL